MPPLVLAKSSGADANQDELVRPSPAPPPVVVPSPTHGCCTPPVVVPSPAAPQVSAKLPLVRTRSWIEALPEPVVVPAPPEAVVPPAQDPLVQAPPEVAVAVMVLAPRQVAVVVMVLAPPEVAVAVMMLAPPEVAVAVLVQVPPEVAVAVLVQVPPAQDPLVLALLVVEVVEDEQALGRVSENEQVPSPRRAPHTLEHSRAPVYPHYKPPAQPPHRFCHLAM